MTSSATQIEEDLSRIRTGLNKKATFLSSTAELSSLLKKHYTSVPITQSSFFSVISRVNVLLRSRYSDITYWRAGADLFRVALEIITDSSSQRQIQEWHTFSRTFFDKEDEKEKEKENQQKKDQPRQQGPPQPENQQEMLEELIRSLGADVEFSGGGNPPASRDSRHDLRVVTIEKTGENCPICQEDFPIGAKAKKMPCSHLFHDDCVIEWLEKHNSCPICRHALPSEKQHHDDIADRIFERNPALLPSAIYS
eukprot:TRINITY_DN10159_c0_g1_i1.p1 TRINITY_DN10159_c0_g1~~TRINITY_DN10159_c0_g1_i1.p1  ORF type:complete len:262 (-),score=55.51 TRINITY_DN10159_c0_g1_i1:150-908(-)